MTDWFFTSPLEASSVRRGDPLGMRAHAEEFAEVLAPGLSNRTLDGRWLSIACWALQQASAAWRALGAVDHEDAAPTRDAARELYAWLRPLELLWLARTVEKTEDGGKGRQLPGVRAVKRWLEGNPTLSRFGFAPGSYERYRFAGIYGAYRVALRSLPRLTQGGDGWRVDRLGIELAEVVHGHVRCARTHRRTRGRRRDPASYWQDHFEWQRGGSELLPTLLASPRRVARPERELLRRALFTVNSEGGGDDDPGTRRRKIVEAAARSSATDRAAMFADVARTLGGAKPFERLRLLSAFCQLADAGVAAMNACWRMVRDGDGTGFARAADVVATSEVSSALEVLAESARRWQREAAKERGTSRQSASVADALATGVLQANDNSMKQLRALERHHHQFGGGFKWLAIDGTLIKPLAPLRGGDASEYRFRIGALARLGVQSGVIGELPLALRESDELHDEEDV